MTADLAAVLEGTTLGAEGAVEIASNLSGLLSGSNVASIAAARRRASLGSRSSEGATANAIRSSTHKKSSWRG